MFQKHRGLRGRAFALGAILLGWSAAVMAGPFAYVPNSGLSGSGPSTVSVIDTATNTVIGTITVGPRPRTVSVSPTQVFIANQGELAPSDTGSVSVISVATNTVTATIPVEGAFGIASFGDRLYVSGFTNAVSVISLTSNTVIATIPIPGGIPSAGVGAEPLGVVVSPSGARVYTSNFIDKSVSVIDTASLSIVATVRLTDQPQAIAIDPSGSRVYTANLNSVSVIDTATNSLVTNIPASITNGLAWPQGLAVNPSGTSLYVTNSMAGTVSVFSTATLSPTTVVSISGSPQGISFTPDGSKAYVADKNQDLVHVISTASNTLIASIPVGITPISIGNFIVPGGSCAGLTVSPSFLSYPASGGPRTLTITAPATCRWTLSHIAGWLTPGSATGTGSGTVVLTASAVASGQFRRATVTVSGSGETRLVRVTQGDLIIDPPLAKTAMTWAKVAHDNTWGIDRMDCTSSTMACNPYTGDTSCNNSLPVLCVRPQGLPRPPYTPNPSLFYDGWVGGSLALTAPVLGTSLTSQATADALCATTFGSAWRMAEFHDGGGGWGFRGYGNILDGGSRFWVRISDQPANCW